MAALRRATEQQTMKAPAPIRCVFVDVGGVLLTDGWGHRARRLAATTFKLELSEMQERHELTFDTYEEGSSRSTNTFIAWCSTRSDRSRALSFDVSCLHKASRTPR